MGRFLTDPPLCVHTDMKKMYRLAENVLYQDDDGTIYLAWRNFTTDNFTWINSTGWDVRCAHEHDIGCKYHQVVKVILKELSLRAFDFIYKTKDGRTVCRDIPIKYLKVVDVSGNWINNLFYRCLKAADCPKTPKAIQLLYRAGVSLNFNWFRTGKQKIDLNRLYDRDWNNE